MKKTIILLSAILWLQHALFSQIVRGTSILIIASQDSISIGADSRSTFLYDNGKKVHDTINKIYNFGETFYFISGQAIEYKEGVKIFDGVSILSHFVENFYDFSECLELFTDSINKAFQKSPRAANYFDSTGGLQIFMSAGIVRMGENHPDLLIFEYYVNRKTLELVPQKHGPLPQIINYPLCCGIGKTKRAREYLTHNLRYKAPDSVHLVAAIEREINNAPEDVNYPIQIVTLHKGRHKIFEPYFGPSVGSLK